MSSNRRDGFLILIPVGALMLLIAGITTSIEAYRLAKYVPVRATIDRCNVSQKRLELLYRYTVDGREYQSDSPRPFGGFNESLLAGRWNKGDVVDAWYDPADPAAAFLVHERGGSLPVAAFGAIFLLLAALSRLPFERLANVGRIELGNPMVRAGLFIFAIFFVGPLVVMALARGAGLELPSDAAITASGGGLGLLYGFMGLGFLGGIFALLSAIKPDLALSPMVLLGLAVISPGLGLMWNDVEPRLAKERLDESGGSAPAQITAFWRLRTDEGLGWNRPATATFTFQESGGTTVTATCFTWDAELARRWKVGETALARYDRANPSLATLEGGLLTQSDGASTVIGGGFCALGSIFCALGFTVLRPKRNRRGG